MSPAAGATPAPDSNVERLKALLPDFDVEQAVQRLGGYDDIYVDALKIFVGSKGFNVAHLEDLWTRKDYSGIAAFSHSLKGFAGSVGAIALQSLADELESAMRHGGGSEHEALVRQLASVLDRTCGDISNTLEQLDSSDTGQVR